MDRRGAGPHSVLFLILLGAGLTGCGEARTGMTDDELRAALELPRGAGIHRVEVTVADERLRVLPLRTRVRQGDVVRFAVLDHRDHVVRFQDGEMDPEPLAFLRRTGQDRPPPLLGLDARLVLDLREAPAGRYPFRVESSGLSTAGEILVESR
jgi:plastocyanin